MTLFKLHDKHSGVAMFLNSWGVKAIDDATVITEFVSTVHQPVSYLLDSV